MLGTAVPCPPPIPSLLILSSPGGRSAGGLEQERRKDVHGVQGLLFIYIKTLTSATVPPLSKQQLPAQARLCLQTCVLREPLLRSGGCTLQLPWLPGPGARGGRSSRREAENGSHILLPSSVTVLLAAPVTACLPPSFCPVSSELKLNPYTHMQ